MDALSSEQEYAHHNKDTVQSHQAQQQDSRREEVPPHNISEDELTPTHHVQPPFTPPTKPVVPILGTTASFQQKEAIKSHQEDIHRDIVAAMRGIPSVTPHFQHHYFKIILIGDNGLGKTTFTHNLFAAYASNMEFSIADASHLRDAPSVFSRNPPDLCTELVVQDDISHICWHYTIQDTPGYGDFDHIHSTTDHRRAVHQYLVRCNEEYLHQEFDPERSRPFQSIADSRVDVCIYFIPPHNVRAIDVQFIKELSSQGIPVIPVISKADSLTTVELVAFRRAVRAVMGDAIWHFSADAMDAAQARQEPPFAVISSSVLDKSASPYWPVREYPWGKAFALSSSHSDLPLLRRLLFETAYWELKEHTEIRYMKFRKSACTAGSAGVRRRVLRPAVQWMAGVITIVTMAFIAVNAGPVLKSARVRERTVKRAKERIGEVVESAVSTGKKAAEATVAALEVPEVKKVRKEEKTRGGDDEGAWPLLVRKLFLS